MNRDIYVYKKTEDYKVDIEEAGGFVFIHIYLDKLTPSIVKELKKVFDEGCEFYSSKGHEIISATTKSDLILRLCKIMRTPYCVKPIKHFGEDWYVVVWETVKED